MTNKGNWLSKFGSVMDWNIVQPLRVILKMNIYRNKHILEYIVMLKIDYKTENSRH